MAAVWVSDVRPVAGQTRPAYERGAAVALQHAAGRLVTDVFNLVAVRAPFVRPVGCTTLRSPGNQVVALGTAVPLAAGVGVSRRRGGGPADEVRGE